MATIGGLNIKKTGLVFSFNPKAKRCYPRTGNVVTELGSYKQGTIANATFRPDIAKGVFEFDGTDDYINFNYAYTAAGQEIGTGNVEYTIEAWIYVRSSSGTTTSADAIIGNRSSTGIGFQVGISNGNPRINYGARSTSNFYSSEFSYNTWMHVTLTRFTSDPNCITYLNGVLDISADNDLNTQAPSDGDMRIGNASGRVPGYFDGYIGSIRIYNTALSAEQVLRHYSRQKRRFGL